MGANQYAYLKRRGYKDALATNVCTWLLALENGEAIGLYCSDVAGAFDRVRSERLVSKLEVLGLPNTVVRFLESWLQQRKSVVVVGGAASSEWILCDSVFQGTVFGPPLWNVFYADASRSTSMLGFEEVVFADDYNCPKGFETPVPTHIVLDACKDC